MPETLTETRETLKALERLIAVAEAVGLTGARQLQALDALRGRRATLRRTLRAREGLRANAIVSLAAWREAALPQAGL